MFLKTKCRATHYHHLLIVGGRVAVPRAARARPKLGESPMAYVRRIRLGRVRAELLRSDPTTVRVTDVAM